MNGKIKPSELHIAEDNITSNEKNLKYFDEGLNDTQDWGEHEASIKLINISIAKEPSTIRCDDDVQK
jgi:hypothetical protein